MLSTARPLDETLARLQPDAIILAGINTHACIRTTAIDAYQRDWNVILALDCIDSHDREHHEVSLRYMKDKLATVMSNADILSALRCPDLREFGKSVAQPRADRLR